MKLLALFIALGLAFGLTFGFFTVQIIKNRFNLITETDYANLISNQRTPQEIINAQLELQKKYK